MIGGELVREARRRAGLTQKELADRAGTTQSAIARLESGRTSPSLERLEWLLKLCGISLIVRLMPYDDSHLVQAKAKLRKPVEARMRDNSNMLKVAREWQEAFERAQST